MFFLVAFLFSIVFVLSLSVIRSNSIYKAEVKQTLDDIVESVMYFFSRFKDLVNLLIKDSIESSKENNSPKLKSKLIEFNNLKEVKLNNDSKAA